MRCLNATSPAASGTSCRPRPSTDPRCSRAQSLDIGEAKAELSGFGQGWLRPGLSRSGDRRRPALGNEHGSHRIGLDSRISSEAVALSGRWVAMERADGRPSQETAHSLRTTDPAIRDAVPAASDSARLRSCLSSLYSDNEPGGVCAIAMRRKRVAARESPECRTAHTYRTAVRSRRRASARPLQIEFLRDSSDGRRQGAFSVCTAAPTIVRSPWLGRPRGDLMLRRNCVAPWRACLVAGLLTVGIATIAPSLGNAQDPVPCTPPPGPAPPGGVLCSVPPPPPAPAADCTPPPGPAPPDGVLCLRGAASISGATGCAGTPFNVVVRGRQIERVTFTLDGKVVRTLTRPNHGSWYVLPVNPRLLIFGVYRVLARTVFRSQSGTPARTLRVVFRKCARVATSPAFTG
jgi:hypothetical protein